MYWPPTCQIVWRILDNVGWDIEVEAVWVTPFQKIIAENETCGKDVAHDGSFLTYGRRSIHIVFYYQYFRGKPIIGPFVVLCRRVTSSLVAWFT